MSAILPEILAFQDACRAKHLRHPPREAWGVIDAARDAMLAATGYDRVHDHMGEFCNIHQRDLPSFALASVVCRDGRELFSYCGYQQPVTRERLDEIRAEHERRSAELAAWLSLPPVERFLTGVCAGSLDDVGGQMIVFRDGRLTTLEPHDWLYVRAVRRVDADDSTARAAFEALSRPFFTTDALGMAEALS